MVYSLIHLLIVILVIVIILVIIFKLIAWFAIAPFAYDIPINQIILNGHIGIPQLLVAQLH